LGGDGRGEEGGEKLHGLGWVRDGGNGDNAMLFVALESKEERSSRAADFCGWRLAASHAINRESSLDGTSRARAVEGQKNEEKDVAIMAGKGFGDIMARNGGENGGKKSILLLACCFIIFIRFLHLIPHSSTMKSKLMSSYYSAVMPAPLVPCPSLSLSTLTLI
jgi:hypothetical protein